MPFSFSKAPKRSRKGPRDAPQYNDGQIINAQSLPTAKKARDQHLQSVSSQMVLPGGKVLLRMRGRKTDEMHKGTSDTAPAQPDSFFGDDNDWEDCSINDTHAFELQTHEYVHTASSRLLGQERAKISREKQRRRWKEVVLPRILPHYLAFQSQRHENNLSPQIDTTCCCEEQRMLNILVLQWNALQNLSMTVCKCEPAAEQLLKQGLFPCSPIRPTVAINIDLLELIITSFLHLSLNVTGWADLLIEFWAARGFRLAHTTSLRRQLSSCVIQYQQLQQLAALHLNQTLVVHRTSVTSASNDTPASLSADDSVFQALDRTIAQPSFNESTTEPPTHRNESSQLSDTVRPSLNTITSSMLPPAQHNESFRPSDSLRSKCPLCFGGEIPQLSHSNVHSIVCLDACFSQKRRKSKYPDFTHIVNSSYFLSQDAIREMEQDVSKLRSRKPLPTHSVQVANDILDDCERSFRAAQESNAKASTNFFADTGLMALLCRHDRVLFLANLVSAGEKQHYALALLEALFKELPTTWKLGVLYDIGCQLHRSCEKAGLFNLLQDYRHRIIWSISVFHAYGHQWVCQLVYHPRKRKDFGYTDGEGCERFWSLISSLVGPLRVSGYHRRLFCLDIHVQYRMSENLKDLAKWLTKKEETLVVRCANAKRKILECRIPADVLRAEWNSQVSSQTKALPRQLPKAAAHAVGKPILLRNELSDAEERLRLLKELPIEVLEMHDKAIVEAEVDTAALRAKSQAAERALGTALAYATLAETENNRFLETRLKALAIKKRLLSRLQARKFEFSKLDQHSRRPVLGNKLYMHAKGAIHRREVGIKSLAHSFNRLIDTLAHLQSTCERYQNEIVPTRLNVDQLFRLDVFSVLWEDDGLLLANDIEERWRTDRMVRDGINAMLELDRCLEEEERLRWETKTMAAWVVEEVLVVEKAFNAIDPAEIGMRHAIVSHISQLWELLQIWASSKCHMLSNETRIPACIDRLAALALLPAVFYGAGSREERGAYAIDSTDSEDSVESDNEDEKGSLISMELSDDEDFALLATD